MMCHWSGPIGEIEIPEYYHTYLQQNASRRSEDLHLERK